MKGLIFRLIVPNKAIRACWPKPPITLEWADLQLREQYLKPLSSALFQESPLLKKLRELE